MLSEKQYCFPDGLRPSPGFCMVHLAATIAQASSSGVYPGGSPVFLPHFLPHTSCKTWQIWVPWSLKSNGRKPLRLLQITAASGTYSFERITLITRRSEVRILPPLLKTAAARRLFSIEVAVATVHLITCSNSPIIALRLTSNSPYT
jgi:hypothetical protein